MSVTAIGSIEAFGRFENIKSLVLCIVRLHVAGLHRLARPERRKTTIGS
jgi:phosphotransferase system IIB component